MNYIKVLSAGAVGGLLVLVGSFFFSGMQQAHGLGAAANVTTIGNPWVFTSTVTHSGAITNSSVVTNNGAVTNNAGTLDSYALATTTAGTAATLALADFNGYDTIILTPNVAADTTLTFPASSTVTAFLAVAGDTQRTCYVNATTSAATTGNYVFAGGTGFKLQVASSSVSALGGVRLLPGKTACVTFVRNGATATTFDVNAAMTVFQ